MKSFFICTLMSVCTISVLAQSKMSPAGRLLYDTYKINISDECNVHKAQKVSIKQGILIEVKDNTDFSKIEETGFEINNIMGNVISGTIELGNIELLESLDCVLNISFGERYDMLLDFARQSSFADDVQTGFINSGSSFSFDGDGVVTGMMDSGLEGNHINFFDEAGNSRISQLWHFTSTTGNNAVKNYRPGNIFRFSTDNSGSSHATHVAGIMAGSYNGVATYYKTTNPSMSSSVKYENAPCPYYGVSTGSELAFSVGSLSDANISDGVSNIVEYAKSVNKPAVVNLSIGSNTGPHDGSDLLTKVFAYYGREAILCIAAGNEGDLPLFAGKSFTADDKELKLQFLDNTISGLVDVWANDSKALNFKWAAYNVGTKELETICDVKAGDNISITTSNSIFAKYFSGSIRVTAGVSSLNNRYQIYSDCSSVKPLSSNTGVMIAIVVSGEAGQKVYAYAGTGAEFNPDVYIPGWDMGTTTNSINNLACGENTICVGSYNTRAFWTILDGNSYTLQGGITVNEISNYSSYGANFEGKKLPDVAAPGCGIISSVNKYNITNSNAQCAQAYNEYEGGNDYWDEMQGTSMACPMVSGIVALWLQADPTLDYARIMDIINSTSVTDRYTRKAPERFGAGKIDALAGIKKVLDEKASVGAIFADDVRNFIVTPVDGGYNVYVGGEREVTVTVYDMSGRAVATAAADDNTVDVATAHLAKGVYILTAQGNTQRHSTKIVVK